MTARAPFHFLRRHWRALAIAAASFVFVVAMLNWWMLASCSSSVFRDLSALPPNDVGLVLGTSRLVRGGGINPHFQTRIDAAAAAFRAGKVKHLLLSGDNRRPDYDEPTDMKNALIAVGIPESAMTLDYAGLRTLDSVVRAKEIFGLSRVTLITEDFHAPRAVFLAHHSGLEAVAFAAEPVALRSSLRSRAREVGARIKAWLDIYILHTGPRSLGDPVRIKLSD
jgi:SanA protein